MTITATNETATAAASIPSLPTGAWDLISFLGNTQDYGELAGGALISLLGLIIVIVAGVFTAKKFFGSGNGQNDKPWLIIAVMFIVGGAMLFGSIGLLLNISSGGQKTIEELGGGFIVLQSSVGLLR